jgi:four helix bundle protein
MAEFFIYTKARSTNKAIALFLRTAHLDRFKSDQLIRASNSFVLNIAEGNARFTNKDRKSFFINARGSVSEVIALFDLLEDEEVIPKEICDKYRDLLVELLKMLTTLIGNLMKKDSESKAS